MFTLVRNLIFMYDSINISLVAVFNSTKSWCSLEKIFCQPKISSYAWIPRWFICILYMQQFSITYSFVLILGGASQFVYSLIKIH